MPWVEDKRNGLKTEKEVGEYIFELQYKPSEYIIALENKNNSLSNSELKKKVQEVSDLQYFNLKIIAKGKSQEMLRTGTASEQEYQNRISYFSYDAQKDIRLIDGNDTVNCVLYHFERSYNLAPYSNLVLGFPKKKQDTEEVPDKILAFDEKVLGIGKINIKIESEDLKSIPLLKLE